jgi:hypothetical protein
MQERTQPSEHFVTATTHTTTDELGPVEATSHYFTVHCVCGAHGYADGTDPEVAWTQALDQLHA